MAGEGEGTLGTASALWAAGTEEEWDRYPKP